MWDLLDPDYIEGTVQVLTDGAKKYAKDNNVSFKDALKLASKTYKK